jgi:hypothetical protein
MSDKIQQPWFKLGIDCSNAYRPGFERYFDYKSTKFDVWVVEKSDPKFYACLRKSWVDSIESKFGLELDYFLLFYRAPHFQCPTAHIDGSDQGIAYRDYGTGFYTFGVNFVTDADDNTEMLWYNKTRKDDGIVLNRNLSAEVNYKEWLMSDIQDLLIDRKVIGTELTLVDTTRAHNIFMRDKPRWGFTLRFKLNSLDLSTWERAVEYFKPHIKYD